MNIMGPCWKNVGYGYNGGAVKLELDIPIGEDAIDESVKSRLRHDALEAAVLRLFEERRISSAAASEDLGLTRLQFMELTTRRGIPQRSLRAFPGARRVPLRHASVQPQDSCVPLPVPADSQART